MQHSILIDLGKLKDLYSGLGQVSLHFGKAISRLKEDNIEWHFLIPKGFEKEFGTDIQYEYLSEKRRYFPALCPDYDLWHAIHQDSDYMPSDKTTPYILTIHDLNFLEEKSQAKAKARLDRLQKKVDRANAITFISKFTEAVARKHLHLPDIPTQVIYNGVSVSEQAGKKPEFVSEKPFLCTIGVIKAKKNFHVLIDFMKELPEHDLIIAGNKSDAYAEKMEVAIAEAGLQDRILMPGKITDEEKAYLLQNCTAFVFPSKYEGFGLPAIEAMKYGKPVFLSTCSSLPEIGGNAAFYWESFEPEYMKRQFQEKMAAFEKDKASQTQFIQEHAAKYSWTRNARSYLDLYKKLLQR